MDNKKLIKSLESAEAIIQTVNHHHLFDSIISDLKQLKWSLEPLTKDQTGVKCTTCGKGRYKEEAQDDWNGTLHCDKCGAETERWVEK